MAMSVAAKKASVLKKAAAKRPEKLREWSNESMVVAIKAVHDGTFGVNRAALEYGVPKTTLKDNGSAWHQSRS